jgi:cardiolipin synthase
MEIEAAEAIAGLARVLTGESADQIARLIAEGASSSRIEAIAGTAAARTALRRLTRLAEPGDAAGLALALRAASLAHRHADEEQRVSLVWSGPDAAGAPMRRTEQALCEVIAEARHHLLVASYTVVAVPAVNRALEEATTRDVAITLVVETPATSDGRIGVDPLRQLGAVAGSALVLTWDRSLRPSAASGRVAIVHAKCACADDRIMLLSSANLTPQGLGINIELGLLIRGGGTPRSVRERFEQLRVDGVLRRVDR